jgi:hypothetical protein
MTHATRDHGPGQTQKDEALRVCQHILKDLKTLVDVSTLKRGMLKGLHQIEEGTNPFEVQMLNRMPKKF